MNNNRKVLATIRSLSEGTECPDDEYRFEAVLSNKDLDAYHSWVDDESLDNFVRVINGGGVALLNNHRNNGLEDHWGRWISAKREGDTVIAVASMLRDNEDTPDHLKINEHIRRVERGYYTDVSIGFYGHKDVCDLCNEEIFGMNSKCRHWPGDMYDINGEEKKCTYGIKGAHLAEASLVYDGANDAALITKRNAPVELVNHKQSLWDNSPGQLQDLDSLNELERIGLKYKQDKIDELVVEGVRAMGNDFDEEKQRAKYERWSIEDIEDQIKTYKKFVGFTGGRKVQGSNATAVGAKMPAFIFG